MLGQAEAVAIVLGPRARIGHEHHGRGLLDQRGRDAAVERVARTLGGEADQRVALAQGLEPVADARGEHLVVERLPALVDQDHRGRAVEPLVDAVEQVHHHRRAQARAFKQRGHVEADDAGGQVEPVMLVVEQPAVFVALRPGFEPAGKIAGLRTTRTGQEFAEMRQAPQRRIVGIGCIDRARDGRVFFRPCGGQQDAEPVAQESRGWPGLSGSAKRIEAGRMARGDPAVGAADAAHEYFRAAILVEQHGARG